MRQGTATEDTPSLIIERNENPTIEEIIDCARAIGATTGSKSREHVLIEDQGSKTIRGAIAHPVSTLKDLAAKQATWRVPEPARSHMVL